MCHVSRERSKPSRRLGTDSCLGLEFMIRLELQGHLHEASRQGTDRVRLCRNRFTLFQTHQKQFRTIAKSKASRYPSFVRYHNQNHTKTSTTKLPISVNHAHIAILHSRVPILPILTSQHPPSPSQSTPRPQTPAAPASSRLRGPGRA